MASLLVPLLAPPSRADSVPDTGCTGRSCYLGTDMAPVTVDVFADTEPDKATRMVLPRAYVNTAVGYDQRSHPALPDTVRTRLVQLHFMWPDARPYSLALADRDRPPPNSTHYSHDYYFDEPGRDLFARVECHSDTKPIYFCAYHVRVAPDLHVKAHFLDFRFHGGRAFANERMALVRRTVCAFTPTCRTNSGSH